MEWLPGTLVGGAIGLVSGLGVAEYREWRQRRRRRRMTADLFRHEISLTKRVLEQMKNKIAETGRQGTAIEYAGPLLPRDVYRTCLADLSLLSAETCGIVLTFYQRLTNVDFVVQEGYLRRSLYRPARPEELDAEQRDVRRMAALLFPGRGEEYLRKITLQGLLDESVQGALGAADEALAALQDA